MGSPFFPELAGEAEAWRFEDEDVDAFPVEFDLCEAFDVPDAFVEFDFTESLRLRSMVTEHFLVTHPSSVPGGAGSAGALFIADCGVG